MASVTWDGCRKLGSGGYPLSYGEWGTPRKPGVGGVAPESKTYFLYNDVFSIEFEFATGAVKPEGGKSSALYQNPASTHFECFLDI